MKFAPGDSWDLLSYPACCVQSERRASAFVGEAFAKAIVDKAGGDPKLVSRPLKNGLERNSASFLFLLPEAEVDFVEGPT